MMSDEREATDLRTLLFLTADLVFSSRVAAVAERLGARMQLVSAPAVLLEKLTAAGDRPVVLLDLNTSGFDPQTLVPELRRGTPAPVAVIAYGPHVHEARLAAAVAAGCEPVLTRGQFNARME